MPGVSHIILAVFDVQSYELLIYLCGRGNAARDEIERRIIVCAASFFLFSFFFSFTLYMVIAGFSPCGVTEKIHRRHSKQGVLPLCLALIVGAAHIYFMFIFPVSLQFYTSSSLRLW